MTIHRYLMQAVKDDARRAGETERVLLEARRVGLTRPPGAALAVPVIRAIRVLFRLASRAQAQAQTQAQAQAQDKTQKRTRPAGEVQPAPD